MYVYYSGSRMTLGVIHLLLWVKCWKWVNIYDIIATLHQRRVSIFNTIVLSTLIRHFMLVVELFDGMII